MKRIVISRAVTCLVLCAVPATAKDVTSALELEAFLDGVMAVQLDTHHIAGATVAVVKEGQILFWNLLGFRY